MSTVVTVEETGRRRREETILEVWRRSGYKSIDEFLRAAARPWSEEARLLGEALGYTGRRAYFAGMVAARATLRRIERLRFMLGADAATEKLLVAANEVLKVGDTAAKLLKVSPAKLVAGYFTNPAFRTRVDSVLKRLVSESPLLSQVKPSPSLVLQAYAQLLPARSRLRILARVAPALAARHIATAAPGAVTSIGLQLPMATLSIVARMVPGGDMLAWGLHSIVFEAKRTMEEAVMRWRLAAARREAAE